MVLISPKIAKFETCSRVIALYFSYNMLCKCPVFINKDEMPLFQSHIIFLLDSEIDAAKE